MKNSKILIVEDEVNLRETWELMLLHFGFSVHIAANGLEAVKIIDQHPIDIIISDIQMPVKDGYFILEHIKSNNLDILTWICSGQLSPTSTLAEYNIDKILIKPFNMLSAVQELISIITSDDANKT
ncbi:MAG: response regulator [Flavobacteriales bacterium]|nr:response regulator [Flavobacteriales bacterium]